MRRTLAPLLGLVLLSACGSDPAPVAEPSGAASPRASAAPIEGLEQARGELSREHRDGPLEYDTVPPVGGAHNPRWLACDVYDEPVPEEVAVHSLEHGAVWFAHDPDLAEDQVERLAAYAERDQEYVLVSPVEGLAAPVVAVAWGVTLEVESADDERLDAFLQQYAGGGQGGEPGAPCRGSGLTLREARGLLGTSA